MRFGLAYHALTGAVLMAGSSCRLLLDSEADGSGASGAGTAGTGGEGATPTTGASPPSGGAPTNGGNGGDGGDPSTSNMGVGGSPPSGCGLVDGAAYDFEVGGVPPTLCIYDAYGAIEANNGQLVILPTPDLATGWFYTTNQPANPPPWASHTIDADVNFIVVTRAQAAGSGPIGNFRVAGLAARFGQLGEPFANNDPEENYVKWEVGRLGGTTAEPVTGFLAGEFRPGFTMTTPQFSPSSVTSGVLAVCRSDDSFRVFRSIQANDGDGLSDLAFMYEYANAEGPVEVGLTGGDFDSGGDDVITRFEYAVFEIYQKLSEDDCLDSIHELVAPFEGRVPKAQ